MKTRLDGGGGKPRSPENWCAEMNEQQVTNMIPQLPGLPLLVEHDPLKVIGKVLAAEKTHGAGINITAIIDVAAYPAAHEAAKQIQSGYFIGLSLAHGFSMVPGQEPVLNAFEASVCEYPGRKGSNIHTCRPIAGVCKRSATKEGSIDIYRRPGEITMVGDCKMSELTADPSAVVASIPTSASVEAPLDAPEAAPPTPTEAAHPTSTEAAQPTPTEAAQPTPTEAAHPSPTEAAHPTPTEAAPLVQTDAIPVARTEPTPPATAGATPPAIEEATPPATPPATVEATPPATVEGDPGPLVPPGAASVELLSKAAKHIELLTKTIETQRATAAAQTAAFARLELAMGPHAAPTPMSGSKQPAITSTPPLAVSGRPPQGETLLQQAAARLQEQASTIRRQEDTINYTSGFSAHPTPTNNMEGVCAASGTKRHNEEADRVENDTTFRTFYNDRVGDAEATSKDMHRLFTEYKGNARTGLVLASAKRRKRGTLLPDDHQAVDDGTEFVSARDFCPELMEKIMQFSTGAAPSAEHVDELVKATHMC
jgi:hypothetical protein